MQGLRDGSQRLYIRDHPGGDLAEACRGHRQARWIEEPSPRDTGTVVEVDYPKCGKYLIVGNPIKLSDSPADVQRSPLLGEHTEQSMSEVLGFSTDEGEAFKAAGAFGKTEATAVE